MPETSTRLFRDRSEAGRVLAGMLERYRGRKDVVVLALPRGGVPVAYEVATALDAPLDVFLVRKLGVPGHEEFAMGAIASGGVVVLNDDVVRGLGISPEAVERVAEKEGRELARRERAYRGDRPMPEVAGRVVILDAGDLSVRGELATGPRPNGLAWSERGRTLLVADVEDLQARLLAPLVLNSRIALPAGSVFDGTVIKRTPPRMLSRAGSISPSFC